MSAIKTIRYEVPDTYEEEGDIDLDSEEYEDEDEDEYEDEEYEDEHEEEVAEGVEVEVEVEVEAEPHADFDDEEDYIVPYLDQQRSTDSSYVPREKKIPATRVLPVADLPDDFEGEAMDGATYLALAKRSNARLPNSVRRPLPASEVEDRPIPQPRASTSRHPALPSEVWATVFPIHFKNYRQHVRGQWPPSPALRYPDHLPDRPRGNNRGDVWQYINGYRRKLREVQSSDNGNRKGKGKASSQGDDEEMMMDVIRDEDDDEAIVTGERPNGHGDGKGDERNGDAADEVDDEEEAMNSAPRPPRIMEPEPEMERHRPHDPIVSLLQSYSTGELVAIIDQITTYINEALDNLSPFIMIPSTSESRDNPLPQRYMYWLFSCLVLLDDQLDGQSTSSIRELARAAMKVAAWRWVRGVVDKEVTTDHVRGVSINGGAGEGEGGGERWKYGDTRNIGQGEAGLEETMGRCWVLIHAVVAGWAQRDLLDDLEHMFR